MERITEIRDETRKLLAQRPLNLTPEIIAQAIGMSAKWVKTFNKIENPGIVPTETMRRYLKDKIKETAANV